MGGLIEMSQNELDRFHVLNKVMTKELTQKQAANLLSIKERQIRNLLLSLKSHDRSYRIFECSVKKWREKSRMFEGY